MTKDVLQLNFILIYFNLAQQGQLKHRRVKHYGYEFKYDINNVDPDNPLPDGIPDVYKSLLDKLLDSGVVKHYPDQLTVNQYQPGQGIVKKFSFD